MNNNTKRRNGKVINCFICGVERYRSKSDLARVKDGKHTCSIACARKKSSVIKINEIETKLGTDSLSDWLHDKYHNEKMNVRDIALIIYGKRHFGPNVIGWMDRLGIDRRERSEAVSMQWENNQERRKEQSEYAKRKLSKGTIGRNSLIKTMQTKEYRLKASKAKLGANNPMWNDNLTEDDRKDRNGKSINSRWVREVKRRDKHTCQCCGLSGVTVVAHHLNGYNWDVKNRYNIDNGVTLCEPCHKAFHGQYGNGDNTKEQYEEYINKIKNEKNKQLALL